MLRRIKELYGNKLGASDGDLGRVKDFYFDDQNRAIRYLIADTGTWSPILKQTAALRTTETSTKL